MPRRKSAVKKLKQNQKRHLRNKAAKSRLHTESNKLDRMLERGDLDNAAGQLDLLTKLLQRAAGKHVIHPNAAARRQAQWQKRFNEAKARSA